MVENPRGILLEENCSRRCWFAHGSVCRCACGGENHAAMRPGSNRLVPVAAGREMQTVMAGLSPEDWKPATRTGNGATVECGNTREDAAPAGNTKEEKGRMQEGNETMAQQALAVHQKGGDRELLRFITTHRMQDGSGRGMLEANWQQGRFLLEDNSTVVLNEIQGEVGFLWGGRMTARATGIRLSELPPHPGSRQPLMGWPGSDTIMQAVLQRLEKEVWEQQVGGEPWRPGDDPALPEYDAMSAAPDLHPRVLDVVRDRYDMPDDLLRQLDEEVRHCADLVLQGMPEKELEALRAATLARLKQQAEE